MRRARWGFQMGGFGDCRLRVRVCLQRDHLGGQPQLDSQEAKTVPGKPCSGSSRGTVAAIVMAAVSSTSGRGLGALHGLSKADVPPEQGYLPTGPSPEEGLSAQGQRALGHFEVDI